VLRIDVHLSNYVIQIAQTAECSQCMFTQNVIEKTEQLNKGCKIKYYHIQI